MVRTKEEQALLYKCVHEGRGEVEMHYILNGPDELYGKGRMFKQMFLAPGDSVGEHFHNGENEVFYFLHGIGRYNDNGRILEVHPGDTAVCNSGEKHSLENIGDEPLEFIALILY